KFFSVPILGVMPNSIFLDAGEVFGRRRRVLYSTSCPLSSAASYIVFFHLCVIVIFNIAIPSVLSVATVSGWCLSSPNSDFGSGNLWNSVSDGLMSSHRKRIVTQQPPTNWRLGIVFFPLPYRRIDHVPWRVMYSSLLLQTISTVSPFSPSLVGPFFDSNAVSSEDGFVSSPSRLVASGEYNRLPVVLYPGGLRGPRFPSDLNLIVWASSSIWTSSDVLGLNLNISYIVKCFQNPQDLRLDHHVITGSIEIHLVSRINIVGVRADISGPSYPKMLSDIDKIQIIFPEITDGHRVVCLLDYLARSSCFFGLFNPLSNPFALVYHRRLQLWKLVEAFNSGIKVKIIQRFLYIEQASSTNIISYVLMFSLLFILPLRLTSVLSLTMALTMASVETN
ncbi:hypothetical protein HID58_066583, partial [Brassica napus]